VARSVIQDYLQVFPFALFDVAPIESLSLPIFTPLSGFATVSAPEISIETQEIKEANWPFKRHAIKGADVSQITLTRGVTFANSDFWRWIVASIMGDTEWRLKLPFFPPSRVGGPSPRRQLVLVHFFAKTPLASLAGAAAAIIGGQLDVANSIAGAFTAATSVTAGLNLVLGQFGFDVVERVPARAYVLHGCLPTRYKTGGDFDARSGEISIAELDIKPELIEEITLTS
jgi:hypothetical protein